MNEISLFDISASAIGFDLNTRLLRPGLVESTCRAHICAVSSQWPLSVRFDNLTSRHTTILYRLRRVICCPGISIATLIQARIFFKICLLMFKVMSGSVPPCMPSLVRPTPQTTTRICPSPARWRKSPLRYGYRHRGGAPQQAPTSSDAVVYPTVCHNEA